jgi:hypothetical protein
VITLEGGWSKRVEASRREPRTIAGPMVEFKTQQWLSHHAGASSGLLKRCVYFILRPLLSFKYSRYLSPETRQAYRPRFCFGARTLPLESRRVWGSKYLKNVREALVLVQGTGTGWDVISWAQLRPRRIIATDRFPFEDSLGEIAKYCCDRNKGTLVLRVIFFLGE